MNTIKVPRQSYREATIAKDGEGFSMSISSDEPYKRFDFWNKKEYWEVIDHDAGGIDESRLKAGLPILFNHDRDAHLATAKDYSIENGKCIVRNLVWSSSALAQEKKRDAESGALTTTSVGYQLLGEGREIGKKDGLPVYKFKVEIFEGSLVTIPADISVGVGRSKPEGGEPIEVKILKNEKTPLDESQLNGDKRRMTDEQIAELEKSLKAEKERAEKAELALKEANEAHEKALKEAKESGEKAAKDAVDAEHKRTAEIYKLGGDIEKAHSIDLGEAVRSHISEGKSLEAFRDFVLTNNFKAKPLPTGGNEGKESGAMKRDAFEKLNPAEKKDFCLKGGKISD